MGRGLKKLVNTHCIIFMGVLYHKRSNHRLLVVTTVLLFLSLFSIWNCWIHRKNNFMKYLLKENEPLFDHRGYPIQNPKDRADHLYWKTEYEGRVQRVRDICKKNNLYDTNRSWNVASNRRMGNITNCSIDKCTIIVDEQKLFYCFVPKVASTHIKKFFLNISDIPLNDVLQKDNNAMHVMADDALMRVSPAYYSPMQLNRFYKIMFVRHPFDRLVSAFRSKAEQPRSEMPYYYSAFWDPIMKKLRPKGSILDRITFKEFTWYLIHSVSDKYDVHWALFWKRCDPCFVDYDFIGKLETARHDFPYAFRQAGLEFNPEWWNRYPTTNRSVTLKYFASIPDNLIRKLYEVYRLDFELFGYSVNEFLSKNVAVS